MKNQNYMTDPRLLLEDALDALRNDTAKIDVLSDVINRGDLAVNVTGNCLTTKKTENYGLHTYDENRTPKHIITIYRSSKLNMLRAMIHELIHAWQFETKKDWIAKNDSSYPSGAGDEFYFLNGTEREARSYEALAAAFFRNEKKANAAYSSGISMIREYIVKAESCIDDGRIKKAERAMRLISEEITKYEVNEGVLTTRQTAKIAEYRAQYLEDLMYLADARNKKERK
jgi:hypothetical protein